MSLLIFPDHTKHSRTAVGWALVFWFFVGVASIGWFWLCVYNETHQNIHGECGLSLGGVLVGPFMLIMSIIKFHQIWGAWKVWPTTAAMLRPPE